MLLNLFLLPNGFGVSEDGVFSRKVRYKNEC